MDAARDGRGLMFGYDITTTVAGLVFLGAALSIVPLLIARNFVEIIKPGAIGAGAWVVGNLTAVVVVGTATGLISLLIGLAVVPADEDKVWSETILDRLADTGRYPGWSPEQLAVALKPYGVDTVQLGRRVDGRTVNRRGVVRGDLVEALAAASSGSASARDASGRTRL